MISGNVWDLVCGDALDQLADQFLKIGLDDLDGHKHIIKEVRDKR